LGRRSARLEAGQFVIEGPKLVAEAARAGIDLDVVYVGEGATLPDVGEAAVRIVADGVLERVLDTVSPQPIAALAPLPSHSFTEVVRHPGLVLVGDRIGDPGNVGTIARSLEAFGGAGLVLTTESADPFQPKVVRASAGAVLRLPIVDAISPSAVVAECRRAGRRLLVTTMAGGTSMDEADLSGEIVIVVGSEAHGVCETLVDAADELITIEMAGPTESLNVAMAASILCYEAARAHRSSSSRRHEPLG
jgi:TrmH family RNA methyltransferase